MKSYGAPTPKRHLGYSNAAVVEKLYHGYLTYSGQSRLKAGKSGVATVRKYVDKRGKTRFSGTAYLKLSQQHPLIRCSWDRVSCEGYTGCVSVGVCT